MLFLQACPGRDDAHDSLNNSKSNNIWKEEEEEEEFVVITINRRAEQTALLHLWKHIAKTTVKRYV